VSVVQEPPFKQGNLEGTGATLFQRRLGGRLIGYIDGMNEGGSVVIVGQSERAVDLDYDVREGGLRNLCFYSSKSSSFPHSTMARHEYVSLGETSTLPIPPRAT